MRGRFRRVVAPPWVNVMNQEVTGKGGVLCCDPPPPPPPTPSLFPPFPLPFPPLFSFLLPSEIGRLLSFACCTMLLTLFPAAKTILPVHQLKHMGAVGRDVQKYNSNAALAAAGLNRPG